MLCNGKQRQLGELKTRPWLRGLFGLTLTAISALPTLAQSVRPDSGGLSTGGYSLHRDHSKILFSIGHFFVSSTQGEFTEFDGKLNFEPEVPEHGKVTIHISPGSISTGNAARDDHLRTADFFDTTRFPVATFESVDLARISANTGRLTGMLSLHGVTKPVTLKVLLRSMDLSNDKLSFAAKGTLKRSEFGMNNYIGVIGDVVTLDVEAEFVRDH